MPPRRAGGQPLSSYLCSTAIREALGEFPLAGFFGNGELAPVGRRNFFHNYTGAWLLIPE